MNLLFSVLAAAMTLLSPDGKIEVEVCTGKEISYSVKFAGVQVLAPSAVSMTLSDGTVFGNRKPVSAKYGTVNRTVSAIMYQKSSIEENYNSLLFSFGTYELEFRAFDQGVAYRFASKSGRALRVCAERAEFNFAGDWEAFVPYVKAEPVEGMAGERQFMNTFENRYTRHKLSEWRKRKSGECDSLAFLPLTVKAENCLVCITESDLYSYPGMYLGNSDNDTCLEARFAPYPKSYGQGGYHNNVEYVTEISDYIAEAKAKATFPWRVLAIAGEDRQLMENDMVYLLARPDDGRDWSWVKPGQAVWEWMVNWNLREVGFYAGVNTETYKYFIDYAAKHNVQYLLMDEGWFEIGPADMMKVVPDLDLPWLCRYAAEKNVKIILWAGCWPMKHNLDELCKHYSEMGVAGFKTDFLNRDDAAMVEFVEKAAETTAKYNMVLFFHGVFKPAGLNRKYPNVLNFEANYAIENMKWPTETVQPEYDVTLPYTRLVAGPADINTGLMENMVGWNWKADYNFPSTQGTRCHQLAAFVSVPAPLAMLSDAPSTYEHEWECFNFISSIPTVWDETIAVDGRIGEYSVVARRSGDNWYIGAMTNWDPRTIHVNLDFLEKDTRYRITTFRDGPNSEREGRDYLKITFEAENPGELEAYMYAGGGFAASIEKL